MDNLGLLAGAIAGAVLHRLVGNGLGWRLEVTRRRAMQMAFAFLLSVLAVVLISTVYLSVTTNRNLALHLDSTEARLTHMEQIIQNIEKHSNEMMGNSASSTLSQDPGKINEGEGDPPQRDETMFPERRQDDSHDMSKQRKPWRLFNVPDDHVLVVRCVDDTLRVLIRPPSYNDGQDLHQDDGHSCGGRPDEPWTPSMHEDESYSYRALFWSRPGEERLVPLSWPLPEMWARLTEAMMKKTWEESPLTVEEKTPPESFTIAHGEALFYRPSTKERTTRVLIAAREDVIHLEYPEVAGAGPVVNPLPPKGLLPLTFTDAQRARGLEVHHITFF